LKEASRCVKREAKKGRHVMGEKIVNFRDLNVWKLAKEALKKYASRDTLHASRYFGMEHPEISEVQFLPSVLAERYEGPDSVHDAVLKVDR